jgi:glutaminyl-tRNA synthetase
LNAIAPRFMAVLDPVKLVLTNYPEDQVEWMDAVNNPEDPSAGSRQLPFSRELYIERDDFMVDPPSKFFRLKPGGEVRLRYGYIIKCESFETDPATGKVTQINCTFDAATRSGSETSGERKVKGTIHWVSAKHATQVEVRLYDRLFKDADPENAVEGKSFLDNLNPNSLSVVHAMVEPALAKCAPNDRVQFERNGYFCADYKDSKPNQPVFNRVVTLRDSWAKIQSKS